VLKVEKVKIPTTLKDNEVFIKMEAAPINPADLNIVEGTYGAAPPGLPAVAGIEGVGSIAAVGSGVKNLKPNDRVIPIGPWFGTWRSHAVTTEDKLMKVPNDIPIHYAASLSVNLSTAYRLINDFGNLKAGDVIIQNGANSVVGTAIIQLAKLKGIHTINIVRQGPNTDNTITNLKNLGADLVCTHDYLRTPHFKDTIKELKKPKVAFNCVGGDSATELARNLAPGGILVTYGGMSKRPITIPTSLLIFNDIQLRGFWLTKWVQEHSQEERAKAIEELSDLVRQGKLKLLLEGHKLSDFEFALKRNGEAHRHRKVILELMH
jgi:trans-2-enoyl-CoA reductase